MNTLNSILTSTRELIQNSVKIASSYKQKENSYVFYGLNSDEKEFSMIVTLIQQAESIAVKVDIHWCETSEDFSGLYVPKGDIDGDSLSTLLYFVLNNSEEN